MWCSEETLTGIRTNRSTEDVISTALHSSVQQAYWSPSNNQKNNNNLSLKAPSHPQFDSLYHQSESVCLTWHSDVALGASDWLPWSAQGHQRRSLRWVFHHFLVPCWQHPCPSPPPFPSSPHLPWSFPFPMYDRVLQQHSGTYSPAGFCGDRPIGVRPIGRGMVWVVWRVGVSLHGGVSSSLGAAWTLGAVLCGDGDVYHLGAKDRREKDLGETTEGAEGGAGGQRGSRGVGVWPLVVWCWAPIGHWRRQSIIRMDRAVLLYETTTSEHNTHKSCYVTQWIFISLQRALFGSQPVCPHVLLILYTFKRQNMNQQPCGLLFFSNKLQNDSASWPRCQVVPDDWAAFQYAELISGCVQKYLCQTEELEWQGFSRSRLHVTSVPVSCCKISE